MREIKIYEGENKQLLLEVRNESITFYESRISENDKNISESYSKNTIFKKDIALVKYTLKEK